jgi:site-specific DNA-methyltransferase (adenine-specific)
LWCKPSTTEVALTGNPITEPAKQWDGWGTALKPAHEDWILLRKPLEGTVAQNVLKWGVGGINIDGCRVDYINEYDKLSATPQGSCTAKCGALAGGTQHNGERTSFDRPEQKGRFPANLIHDGSEDVLQFFPNTKSGKMMPTHIENGYQKNCYGKRMDHMTMETYGDSGSSARFFYCAKPSKSERNIGCENLPQKTAGECTDRVEGSAGLNSPRAGAGRTNGSKNDHPTVKSISLMRYLCKLITPPHGVVLDPFCGSGSTGLAAYLEGFQCIMIDSDPHSCEIAEARMKGIIKENNNS